MKKNNEEMIRELIKEILAFNTLEEARRTFISNLRNSFSSLKKGNEKGRIIRKLKEIRSGFYPELGEAESAEYKTLGRLIEELGK